MCILKQSKITNSFCTSYGQAGIQLSPENQNSMNCFSTKYQLLREADIITLNIPTSLF